jgi:hypothetical protein
MPSTNQEKAVSSSVTRFHFLVGLNIHPVILNRVNRVWKAKKK